MDELKTLAYLDNIATRRYWFVNRQLSDSVDYLLGKVRDQAKFIRKLTNEVEDVSKKLAEANQESEQLRQSIKNLSDKEIENQVLKTHAIDAEATKAKCDQAVELMLNYLVRNYKDTVNLMEKIESVVQH